MVIFQMKIMGRITNMFNHVHDVHSFSENRMFYYFSVLQVYVWSKQNPFIHMSFLGLFTFTAAYLPWVSDLLRTVISLS